MIRGRMARDSVHRRGGVQRSLRRRVHPDDVEQDSDRHGAVCPVKLSRNRMVKQYQTPKL